MYGDHEGLSAIAARSKRLLAEDAPVSEPMRPQDRRQRTQPSREDQAVRRRLQRAQRPAQPHTAARPWYMPDPKTDWDVRLRDYPPQEDDRIHRGLVVWPRGDVYDAIHDESKPLHERAHALMDHLAEDRPNIGMHWSEDPGYAQRAAEDGGAAGWNPARAPADREWELPQPVVLHARWPEQQHIETDQRTLERNHVTPNDEGPEYEVPLHKGAPVHITGISWRKHDAQRVDGDAGWNHHDFEQPRQHTAAHTAALQCIACGCHGRGPRQGAMCPACGSLAVTATVLHTDWEKLNPGDMIRTPQGQTVKITGRPRPHETDGNKIYVDTEWGTSLMNRGTGVDVVPYNTAQQEQPDSGNPFGGGNVGFQPEKARSQPQGGGTKTCPNDGSPLQFTGDAWVCPRGDYSQPTNTPGGAEFNNPENVVQTPRRTQPHRTQLWGSRYTTDGRSAIARRAQQVLELEGSA